MEKFTAREELLQTQRGWFENHTEELKVFSKDVVLRTRFRKRRENIDKGHLKPIVTAFT